MSRTRAAELRELVARPLRLRERGPLRTSGLIPEATGVIGVAPRLDSWQTITFSLGAGFVAGVTATSFGIGGGMVAPQLRRHGIGARLVSALEDVARELGFTTIYSGTSTANSLLDREGWRLMETVQYDGEAVSVYEKRL